MHIFIPINICTLIRGISAENKWAKTCNMVFLTYPISASSRYFKQPFVYLMYNPNHDYPDSNTQYSVFLISDDRLPPHQT